jgi:hypothetical protein
MTMSPRTIAKTIKILIRKGDDAFDKAEHAADKAEQFYISAGQYLKQLKATKPKTVTWKDYLKRYCGIGIRRAQELIAIANGHTTLEKVRASKAESMRRLRQGAPRGAPFDPQAIAERMVARAELPEPVARWLTDHPDKTLVDFIRATAPPAIDPNAPRPEDMPPGALVGFAAYLGLLVRGEDFIKILRDSLAELDWMFPALDPEKIRQLTKVYGDVVVAAQNIAERLTGDRHARFQLLPGTGNGRDQTEGSP